MNQLASLILSIGLCLLPCVSLLSQNCSEMFEYFREGAVLEYTHYDKKGKAETVSTHRVRRIERANDTLVAHADITVVQAKNGKEVSSYSVPLKCHKGVLFVNMRSMVPAAETAQSPDMQVDITGTDLTYPAVLRVGESLPDGEMEMTLRMGNVPFMRNRYVIKDRRVEAEETLTTPAGTFKCYKIGYTLEFQLLGARSQRSEIWYAPAVGTVKSVSYNTKGQEEGRMELTKFSK